MPSAPGLDIDRAKAVRLRRTARPASPPGLDIGALARRARRSRHGSRRRSSCGLPRALRSPCGRVDQPAPAMRADVVVGLRSCPAGTDDQDRIVEDVVGDVVADLGDVLDPARLQWLGSGGSVCRPRAAANRDESGEFLLTYKTCALSSVLFAAKAAGVQPIETLHAYLSGREGLKGRTRRAARGLHGMLDIHPTVDLMRPSRPLPKTWSMPGGGRGLCQRRSLRLAHGNMPGLSRT